MKMRSWPTGLARAAGVCWFGPLVAPLGQDPCMDQGLAADRLSRCECLRVCESASLQAVTGRVGAVALAALQIHWQF